MNEMKTLPIAAAALLFCGCASNEPEVKAIHKRPWIGGEFETAPTAKVARENGFKRNGALITRAAAETPLAKAGVHEGDVALAVNGDKVGSEWAFRKKLNNATVEPFTLTLLRGAEIRELQVTPGVEEFQYINHLAFGIGVSTKLEIDVFPNPDFSLIALGMKSDSKRLDLSSLRGKHLRSLLPENGDDQGWKGVHSPEGWRVWLGPISYSRNKVIVSQR